MSDIVNLCSDEDNRTSGRHVGAGENEEVSSPLAMGPTHANDAFSIDDFLQVPPPPQGRPKSRLSRKRKSTTSNDTPQRNTGASRKQRSTAGQKPIEVAGPIDPSDCDPIVAKLRTETTTARQHVEMCRALFEEAEANLKATEEALTNRLRKLRHESDLSFNWLTNFPWDEIVRRNLAGVFKMTSFRPLQHEALNATLLRRDVFAILPTGAGKSLIYQLAALVDAGLTLVVTPLISLSQDQQNSLSNLNIRAECIDSSTPKSVITQIYKDLLPPKGHIPGSTEPRKRRQRGQNRDDTQSTWVRDDMPPAILFVTPEQVVRSKRLMSRLEFLHEAGHLSRVCVDEAHCCSSWGHDFRADYRKLGLLRRQCPNTPILALSATSSASTTEDVCSILEIKNAVTLRGSIDRPNLFYEVREKKESEDDVISDIAHWLTTEFQGQSGIIYVLSKKEADTYAANLSEHGIAAGRYHSDMDAAQRSETHKMWSEKTITVIVATIAFGLGIDNQFARFVIHATMACSVEGYYQESGRCGRDGKPAKCIVLQRAKDFPRLTAFVADKGNDRVRKFYEIYRYSTGRFDEQKRCRRAMIARCFSEGPPERKEVPKEGEYAARDCCDLCRRRSDFGATGLFVIDITTMAKSALNILTHVTRIRPNEKVTMLSLASNWSNTGAKGTQFRGGEAAVDRRVTLETRLEVLIELVLHQSIQEYFRHSSYSINAYIGPGPNVDAALDESARISATVSRKAARELKAYGGAFEMGKELESPQQDARKLENEGSVEDILLDGDSPNQDVNGEGISDFPDDGPGLKFKEEPCFNKGVTSEEDKHPPPPKRRKLPKKEKTETEMDGTDRPSKRHPKTTKGTGRQPRAVGQLKSVRVACNDKPGNEARSFSRSRKSLRKVQPSETNDFPFLDRNGEHPADNDDMIEEEILEEG